MEVIGLLVIAIGIGVPVLAITALLKARATARRVQEAGRRIADLQGDIGVLRRELTRLAEATQARPEQSGHALPPSESRPQPDQREGVLSRAAAPLEFRLQPDPLPGPRRAGGEGVHTSAAVPPAAPVDLEVARLAAAASVEANGSPAPAGVTTRAASVQQEGPGGNEGAVAAPRAAIASTPPVPAVPPRPSS
ncbi:MAG: hypothetical protein ACRD1M_06205, partial [Terriglobales bacterium]